MNLLSFRLVNSPSFSNFYCLFPQDQLIVELLEFQAKQDQHRAMMCDVSSISQSNNGFISVKSVILFLEVMLLNQVMVMLF